jgi:hypothetical protein
VGGQRARRTERDFALFAAGLTSDEVNPFFSTMKSMKDMKGEKAE